MNDTTKLDALCDLLRGAPDEIFLQPHNVPDPDAIASCFALRHILDVRGISANIVYDRGIEKANSLKMIELLHIPMMQARDAHTLGAEDWAVLVDVQKGNSNITDLATDEVAVIDHHEYMGNAGYRFEDVRPEAGSCSAIVAEYFFENGIDIPPYIASALLYGILMDTSGLTRGVSKLDIDMLHSIYPLCDARLICELKGSELTLDDLSLYAEAFKTIEIYDTLAFLRLADVNDSLLGAASDMVMSMAGIDVVVSYIQRPNGIKLSVRSEKSAFNAAQLVRAIVEDAGSGGGHAHMAGGIIPTENIPAQRSIDTFIKYKTLRYFDAANNKSE